MVWDFWRRRLSGLTHTITALYTRPKAECTWLHRSWLPVQGDTTVPWSWAGCLPCTQPLPFSLYRLPLYLILTIFQLLFFCPFLIMRFIDRFLSFYKYQKALLIITHFWTFTCFILLLLLFSVPLPVLTKISFTWKYISYKQNCAFRCLMRHFPKILIMCNSFEYC